MKFTSFSITANVTLHYEINQIFVGQTVNFYVLEFLVRHIKFITFPYKFLKSQRDNVRVMQYSCLSFSYFNIYDS